MAREAKKDPNELTVEQKLKTLFQLQTMLSKIDEIKTLRGELPLEVQDLEDEIAGLSTRIDKIKAEVDELKSAIAGKRVEIETAKASVEKYKSQQDNVRNNREYDFLTKEIEFQTLEIELCEKRIKEYSAEKEEKINCICSVCGIGRPAYKGNNISVSAGHKSYRKSTAYTNGIKSGAVGVI